MGLSKPELARNACFYVELVSVTYAQTIHSNQRKSNPFPNLLFFLQNCGHRKAATDPWVLRFNNCEATKSVHFSPRVCDFQPPCRSHAHLFERDNLHRTTRFSHLRWENSYSQSGGGGGELKWTLKEDRTGGKNKIRSTA